MANDPKEILLNIELLEGFMKRREISGSLLYSVSKSNPDWEISDIIKRQRLAKELLLLVQQGKFEQSLFDDDPIMLKIVIQYYTGLFLVPWEFVVLVHEQKWSAREIECQYRKAWQQICKVNGGRQFHIQYLLTALAKVRCLFKQIGLTYPTKQMLAC